MYVKARFNLAPQHEDYIRSLIPIFGYNNFGEIVYYRTYSRIIEDGGQEHWPDTVIRVINGTFSIRKDWYLKNHIAWDEGFWQDYALRFGISMFKMKWLPPGRGLWAMGSQFVYERGSMALYNCLFVSVGDDFPSNMHLIMDALMCGVGVGFEPLRNDNLKLYTPTGDYIWTIPDTREGWCDATKMLLESFTKLNNTFPIFDYSLVRPAGLPIRGFGGVASGPEPLIELHKQLKSYCEQYIANPRTYDSVRLKTDCVNAIGVTVVSGNVRRSAEIAIGNVSDQTFLDLKNYKRFPERQSIGWMSNNSVKLEKDSDFDKLGEIARRVINNGEPGYLNLQNFKYGRMGKKMKGLAKDRASGMNPCITGETKICLADGRGFVPIKDLIDTDPMVYCINEKDEIDIRQMHHVRITGCKIPILKIIFDDGNSIRVTKNHKLMLRDRSFKEACQLSVGDSVAIFNRYIPDFRSNRRVDQYIRLGYVGITLSESRLIYKSHYGRIFEDEHIHHIDKNTLNNDPKNLEAKDASLHLSDHSSKEQILRHYHDLLNQGYICDIFNNKVEVLKTCENCKQNFWIKSYYREQACCSLSCGVKMQDHTKSIESVRITYSKKREVLRIKQLNIYCDLKKKINQTPTKNEWSIACRDAGVSFTISKPGTPFKNWNELKFFARSHNHKIEMVLEDGFEDVYNGTVNDYHNFISGGWEDKTPIGRKVERGIINLNCGEIPLESDSLEGTAETCNVNDVLPTMCTSEEEFLQACEYATLYCTTVSLLPTHRSEVNKIVSRNRRIGVSIVDYTGWKHKLGVHTTTRLMREGYDRIRLTAKWANEEAGIPTPIRHTTIKPGGTVPKLAGRTAGIGHPNFQYMIRRIRIAKNSAIHELLVDANIPYENDVFDKYTDVFEYPIYCGEVKPSDEVSLWEQAMNLVTVQREWADNAVSNTLNFRPKWVLVADMKDDHNQLSNFVGLVTACELILGDQVEYIVPDRYKIKIKRDKDDINIKVYEYDPRHEENDIEAILSAIAPLTKSVSLLPHTPKGVYQQMPEEGISKEEYEERLSQIEPIDWSNLIGSDGQDELYCTSDNCEIPKGQL